MATSKAVLQLQQFKAKVEKAVKESISPNVMRILGDFALNLIVKRSRLGYGVEENFGPRFKFDKLSPNYIKSRKKFRGLSSTTSPSKSNITRTGQLLLSMRVTEAKEGKFRIEPTGTREKEGKTKKVLTNKELAEILAKKNRTFNRLSQPEYQQLLRFYRRTFGDLLRKRNLLR